MSDPRDIARLEREGWFLDMRRWYRDGVVEGMDGATYQGRSVLPHNVNFVWVRARLASEKVESASPGWVLSILEELFPPVPDPASIDPGRVLKLLTDQELRSE